MGNKLMYVAESQLADNPSIQCVGFAYGTGKSHSLRAAIEEAESRMHLHMQNLGATIIVGAPDIAVRGGDSSLAAVSALVAKYEEQETTGHSEE